MNQFLNILAEAEKATPTEEAVEAISHNWDFLNWQTDGCRSPNVYLAAKTQFDQAKAAGDLEGCVGVYISGVREIFGTVELPAETKKAELAFPKSPFQHYTPHLGLSVIPPVENYESLERWTESQFKRVCEFWGYKPDEILQEAQERLLKHVGHLSTAPDWLKSPAPPRITVVYCPNPEDYCGYAANCTREVVFLQQNSITMATDLAHDPYPGDLGIEVVLSLGARLHSLLHELGHAMLHLIVGIGDHSVPMFWDEGFAEYTAWKLDQDSLPLPYRAYARLAAEDFGEAKLKAALLGEDLYEPRLSSQLIAFVVERWGRSTVLSLLSSLSKDDPRTALADILGLSVDDFLSAWLSWLEEAEVSEAAETWWFSQKARLEMRIAYLLPLIGRVRARWALGILARLPAQGTWSELKSFYPLLINPVREVVNRDLAEDLLHLLPQLGKEEDADKKEILEITLKLKAALDAGDYRTCVDLYLQAVDNTFGPLPPIPQK